MDLSAPLPVLLLAFAPAVMWGFTPVIEKRALSAGGNPIQASLTVVLVDSTVYLVALAVFQNDPFGGISLGTVAIFAGAGAVGTALGRLAIFAGNARVGASISSAVLSARPLFATALAVGFLGEPLSVPTAAGIVVLVFGLGVDHFAHVTRERGVQSGEVVLDRLDVDRLELFQVLLDGALPLRDAGFDLLFLVVAERLEFGFGLREVVLQTLKFLDRLVEL